MKQKLHMIYLKFGNMKREPETIKARLRRMLPQVWEEIDELIFESMLNSLPDQVKVIMNCNGWYTKY